MSSEFTKEEDYREVRQNPETYWQFESTRDCTQLSMMDSQPLCGSRMHPNSDFTGITPDVCPVPSADTTSLLVFPTSVDVSPLGPVTLPSLKSARLRGRCCLILRFLRLQRETLKRISWRRYYQRMIAPSPGRTVSSPWKDWRKPYSWETQYSRWC